MTKKCTLLSMVLVLMMVLSLTSAGAAASQIPASQQGVTYYYDAKGVRLSNAASLSGDAVVEMKKWAEQRLDAAGNPIENEFLVTLQVRTTERIEELSSDTPDAAVTLVVDVSNSMDDCYHCGQEASHSYHGRVAYRCPSGNNYFSGRNTNDDTLCRNCRNPFIDHRKEIIDAAHSYESRLSKAQDAALRFIDQFANETGAEEGDKRYVALITFGSHAAARTEYIDVATASGMLAMELAIKNITVANSGVSFGNNTTDPGGTNIEGGLMLADNMIAANTASGRALDGINYLYTILLTDGTPTYYVNGDNASASTIRGTRGGGSSTTKEDVKDVGVEAAKILAHSAQSRLFSICFGTDSTGDYVWDSQPFSTWNDTTPPISRRDTVGDWLKKFSSAAYDASDETSGLFDSFESVITQIQLAAQAWHVTDLMGPHINYLGNAPVSTGSGVISNDVTYADDTLKWNILGSQYNPAISTVTTQNGVTTGVLGYTCQYYVSLDNLDAAYTNKTAATNANTHALLTYATKDTEGQWSIVEDAPFPVPQVQGLTGSFTFRKLNEEGEPLSGIQFTLRDMVDGADYTMVATSDANGYVTFTGIPSGHPYRLDEQTEDKYLDLGDILFDISWGQFIPKSGNIGGDAAGGYTIVNEYSDHALSGLTLKKVFDGDMPEDAHYVEFTLRGARNHNMNYVQTIRLNNQNNWQNTFANLKPGWYTLHEITSFPGYDNTLSITYQVLENGQLVTKELLDHDGNGSYDIQLNAENQYTQYSATVTNTMKRHTGDVTIQKTFWEHDLNATTDRHMEGLMALAADLYDHITVTVSATPQGAATPLQTITLNAANGFTATFDDLPAGVYTLTETVTGDVEDHAFVHSLFLQNGQEVTRTLTVNKDDQISLELQNHYRHYLGHIRVEKVVTGALTNDNALLLNKVFEVDVWSVDEQKFITTLYLDAQHDWVASTALIPVGRYHLVEKTENASVDGFTWLEQETTLTGDVVQSNDNADSVVILVTPGEDAYIAKTVILTNVYEQQVGNLTVNKAFAPDSDLQKEYFAENDYGFEIFVEGPNQYSNTIYLNKDNNWEETIADLPIGSYSVTERANVDGYIHTFEITNHGMVDITDNGEAVITITNKYEEILGGLIVEKVYMLREGGVDSVLPENLKHLLHDAQVDVTVTHKGDHDSYTRQLTSHNDFKVAINNLSLGEYTLTETEKVALPGYHLVDHSFVPSTLTVVEGAAAPKSILTNVYARDTGSITIEKQFAQGSDLGLADFIAKGLSIHLTLTSEDGVSFKQEFTFSQEQGWSKSFTDLPSGKYYITENAQVAGYDLAAVITVNGTVVNNGLIEISGHNDQISVIITNDYQQQQGALEVQKSFVDEAGQPFDQNLLSAFRVQVTATSTLDASVSGSVMLDAENDFKGRIENLPIGVYALKEEILSGSIPDYTQTGYTFAPATANITKGGTAVIGLTNVYGRDTGSLTVEKVFGANSHLTQKDFEALGLSISVTVTGPSFKEEYTFNKANGWSKTWNDLPTGQYQVTEADASVPGYALNAGISNNGVATVGKDGTVTVTCTNTYTMLVGDLEISKEFQDEAGVALNTELYKNVSVVVTATSAKDAAVTGTVTLNAANGFSGSIVNLPIGEYELREEINGVIAGYAFVKNSFAPATVTVTEDANAVVTAKLTNVYKQLLGDLQISKAFQDEAGVALNTELYKNVSVVVTATSKKDAAVTGTVTLNAANHFSGEIENLPIGEYELREEINGVITGYTFAKAQFTPSTATVTDSNTAVAVRIVNTYTRDLGSITVEKSFHGDSDLSKEEFEATEGSILVTIHPVDDPSQMHKVILNKDNGWKQTVSNLPTGQYRIEESAQVDGYGLTVAITGDQVSDGVVTLEKNAAVNVLVTNRYDLFQGTLVIQKQITGDTDKAPDQFQFTVTGEDGTVHTVIVKKENNWTGTLRLPIGTYTVAEQVKTGSDYRVHTVMNPADGKVTIADGQTVTLSCTNDYEALATAYIPVEKTVMQTGNIIPGQNTFSFQAKFNIPATITGSISWQYQSNAANAAGTFQGDRNAESFFITVQDADTVKGWIVLSGYPSDLQQVTLALTEKTEFATAEEAAAADWILDDTAFGSAEWQVSFDQQCRPIIRRSDADENGAAAAFTNIYTGFKEITPPATGDSGMPSLWMALCLLSLGSILVLALRKRKEA